MGQSVEGMWRGVFPHKNVLGPVMAVAVFTELYVLVASRERPLWRFVLLALFLALIVLSISATALTASAAYLVAAGGFLLWRRDRRLGVVAALIASIFLLSIVALISIAPERLLAAAGKDVDLTGRTDLWGMVAQLIRDRPVFGYGYRSMWLPNDTYTVLADQLTGHYGVTNSENAFLEMTLELGAAGLSILLAMLGLAFWRSARCCFRSISLLGWFTFVFSVMSIVTGLTSADLGQNQNIPWLTFTILFLSCGHRLSAEGGGQGNHQRAAAFRRRS